MPEDRKEAQKSVSVLQTLLKHNSNNSSHVVTEQALSKQPKACEVTGVIGPIEKIDVDDNNRLKSKSVVSLDDVVADGVVLPHGQYETVLRPRIFTKRKAITEKEKSKRQTASTDNGQRRSLFPTSQKGDNNLKSNLLNSSTNSPSRDDMNMDAGDDEDENDYYENECAGEDLSLGMKLTILGGFVIVQELSPLKDGRASPAQMCGVISRGDVLLAINNVNLLGLPFIQLSEELKALNFKPPPLFYGGVNVSRGLTPRKLQDLRLRFAIAEGLALLDKNSSSVGKRNVPLPASEGNTLVDLFLPSDLSNMVDQLSGQPLFGSDVSSSFSNKRSDTLQKVNSSTAAGGEKKEDINEKSAVAFVPTSAKEISLHKTTSTVKNPVSMRSIKDKLEGIAFNLYESINNEHIHRLGWSGFYDLDERNNSLLRRIPTAPFFSTGEAHNGNHETDISTIERLQIGGIALSGAAAIFEATELSDKQELLIIARSESGDTSRMSSVSYLTSNKCDDHFLSRDDQFFASFIQFIEIHVKKMQKNDDDKNNEPDDSSSTQDEKVGIISNLFRRKIDPLPPHTLTLSLYEVFKSFQGGRGKVAEMGMDGALACIPFADASTSISTSKLKVSNFLIFRAIPLWLKSFRPLAWQERKLLWPLNSQTANLLDDPTSEIIVKKQTFDLTAFYFREILGIFSVDALCDFVQRYGCYLDIHHSLVAVSSNAALKEVGITLLKLAEYDPLHQHALSDFTYKGQSVLSSVLKELDKAVSDESHIKHLVALYPYLKPQQVERAAGGKDSQFFYLYLTRLLDASGGKEMARMDADVVATWCILSTKQQKVDRLANFRSVVLDDGKKYNRNLPLLMDLCMSVKEYLFAVDVMIEILTKSPSPEEQVDIRMMSSILENLRTVGLSYMLEKMEKNENASSIVFFKLFQCWGVAANTEDFRLNCELFEIFQQTISHFKNSTCRAGDPEIVESILKMIDFISENAPPLEALSALKLMLPTLKVQHGNCCEYMVSSIRTILKRSVIEEGQYNFSPSLLRIQRIRQQQRADFKESGIDLDIENEEKPSDQGQALWAAIGDGNVVVNK